MSPLRTCVLSVLLVPALALGAAEKMAPTKSNPPPVGVSGSFLVDKTIPAYGVLNQVPHYTDSRANTLYLEIHQVLAEVESQVMAGGAAPVKTDTKKKDAQPAPAIGDARIGELLAKLVELDARIVYRTYLEQWHIDNSFSDLNRATELLALSGRVSATTAEKVQTTKPKQPEAAPVPEAAPKPAPEAPAPAPEAPAPKPDAPAPEAPAPEAPKADPPPAEAPAAPPAEAPAAPPAEAPAAPAVAEPPAAEPPAAEPPAVEPPANQ